MITAKRLLNGLLIILRQALNMNLITVVNQLLIVVMLSGKKINTIQI